MLVIASFSLVSTVISFKSSATKFSNVVKSVGLYALPKNTEPKTLRSSFSFKFTPPVVLTLV